MALSSESPDFRRFCGLARLMLIDRHRECGSGSRVMEKIETLTFAVGMFMTGLLTFVALPLA